MRTLDDICRAVVAANASDEFRIITPIALGNKDGTGIIANKEPNNAATNKEE